MSSDILIGYTGMVSFGHSAFFGLGMYGAAAALLMVAPPELSCWRCALRPGSARPPRVAAFVAYFSTRLRDIYFAITTLIFSQIFYVIIFTWTEVTGGENGLSFRRPALGIPGRLDHAIHARDAALVRARRGRRVLPDPAPHHALAVRHGAAIDPRERAAHARDRLCGRALQDRGGDAVGPVRGTCPACSTPCRTALPRPTSCSSSISGEAVIFNVMGGIGTLVGPIVGAATFLLLREGLGRLFGDQFPYLIPLGFIFIAIIIFLPQGLLGFMRRWLNK